MLTANADVRFDLNTNSSRNYSQFTTAWTYDGFNRLIEEQVTVTTDAGNADVPSNYPPFT